MSSTLIYRNETNNGMSETFSLDTAQLPATAGHDDATVFYMRSVMQNGGGYIFDIAASGVEIACNTKDAEFFLA